MLNQACSISSQSLSLISHSLFISLGVQRRVQLGPPGLLRLRQLGLHCQAVEPRASALDQDVRRARLLPLLRRLARGPAEANSCLVLKKSVREAQAGCGLFRVLKRSGFSLAQEPDHRGCVRNGVRGLHRQGTASGCGSCSLCSLVQLIHAPARSPHAIPARMPSISLRFARARLALPHL